MLHPPGPPARCASSCANAPDLPRRSKGCVRRGPRRARACRWRVIELGCAQLPPLAQALTRAWKSERALGEKTRAGRMIVYAGTDLFCAPLLARAIPRPPARALARAQLPRARA